MDARYNTNHNISSYKNVLQERVGSTECLNDLISVLQLIPLNRIKHFISQEIDELNPKCCKEFYYAQTSIDVLFPSDIIQYILSFGGLYHTKAVSAKWKQYSEQNERNHLTKLYAPIHEIKSPVQYDEKVNKTYIIHQNRTKLHKVETALGYKGPMRNIEQTLSLCRSGDRVLVHDGIYNDPYAYEFSFSRKGFDNNIQLIGVGRAVAITSSVYYPSFLSIRSNTKWYIRNIKFDCSEGEAGFIVEDNAILWMENCTVTAKSVKGGVWAMDGSHLNVKNCRCIGNGLEDIGIGIGLSLFAKEVNVIDCTFKDCGINISDQFEERGNNEMLQLKCVGNIFDIGKDFHPITEMHVPIGHDHDNRKFVLSNRYILRDNLLKCTFENENENADANKIKVIDSDIDQALL